MKTVIKRIIKNSEIEDIELEKVNGGWQYAPSIYSRPQNVFSLQPQKCGGHLFWKDKDEKKFNKITGFCLDCSCFEYADTAYLHTGKGHNVVKAGKK